MPPSVRGPIAALLAVIALGVLAVPSGGPQAAPPAGVTVDAAMARGPADAPVTIVEFSDYQ